MATPPSTLSLSNNLKETLFSYIISIQKEPFSSHRLAEAAMTAFELYLLGHLGVLGVIMEEATRASLIMVNVTSLFHLSVSPWKPSVFDLDEEERSLILMYIDNFTAVYILLIRNTYIDVSMSIHRILDIPFMICCYSE